MSGYYGKGPRGAATELHSKIVRFRYGRCLICGSSDDKPGWLQAAHILGRSASYTRTWSPNLICMCAVCHAEMGNDPIRFAGAIEQLAGAEAYEEFQAGLWGRRDSRGKFDWEDERLLLEAEAYVLAPDWAQDHIRKRSWAEIDSTGYDYWQKLLTGEGRTGYLRCDRRDGTGSFLKDEGRF